MNVVTLLLSRVAGRLVPWRRGSRARAGLLLVVVILAAGCGAGHNRTEASGGPEAASAGAGTVPPGFRGFTLAGEEFDSASRFAAGPTVLWFWAPWCTICRAEAPEVLALAEEFAGELVVVGVAGRGGRQEMIDFVADTGAARLDHVVDADGAIWAGYGVVAQPAFAFVARDGRAEVFNGALPPDDLRGAARALVEGR
jgi:thiol-disulfide isomerase/thioredoxin